MTTLPELEIHSSVRAKCPACGARVLSCRGSTAAGTSGIGRAGREILVNPARVQAVVQRAHYAHLGYVRLVYVVHKCGSSTGTEAAQ